jgi:hypothetical protein
VSDYLSMDPNGVREQANSYDGAAKALSAAAGSWLYMFDGKDLGDHYMQQAGDIVKGFTAVTDAVKNWSDACGAFRDALIYSADNVQSTGTQFSNDLAKVSFDGTTGDLTMGGK